MRVLYCVPAHHCLLGDHGVEPVEVHGLVDDGHKLELGVLVLPHLGAALWVAHADTGAVAHVLVEVFHWTTVQPANKQTNNNKYFRFTQRILENQDSYSHAIHLIRNVQGDVKICNIFSSLFSGFMLLIHKCYLFQKQLTTTMKLKEFSFHHPRYCTVKTLERPEVAIPSLGRVLLLPTVGVRSGIDCCQLL